MNCPLCQQPLTNIICPNCDPAGDAAGWLQLHKLAYMRQEIARWPQLSTKLQTTLSRHYEKAQRAVEIKLGLRSAPPTVAEARELEQELATLRLWIFCLTCWEKRGWLATSFFGPEISRAERRSQTLQSRLPQAAVWPTVPPRQSKRRDLENFNSFVVRTNHFLAGGQIEPEQQHQIHSWLQHEIAALDAELYPPTATPKSADRQRGPKAAPTPKPAHTIPWTWDRLWETLLSEKTLQVILFLGAMLVVAASVSWVAWNWDTFSPPLQIGILSAGTAAFFVAGWHVHNRLRLRGSGIALIGVGALLVPLDIYALYLSGLFPDGSFPWLWLTGSTACLVLYLLVGWQLQTPFFGYLLAAAAGSLAVASLNLWPNQLSNWSPVSMAVALLLILVGRQCARASTSNRAEFLSAPLYHSALGWAAAVLLVGTIYEGVYGGYRQDDLMLLALNFALGAPIFAAGLSRYRWLSLLGAAIFSLPLAGLWSGLWLATKGAAGWPWVGPAWAGLTLVYLLVAWRWPTQTQAERNLIYLSAGLLGLATLAWSLADLLPATIGLLILAAAGPILARARTRSTWLWVLPLALLLAGATWQGHRGVGSAALALPWTLLASLSTAGAVILPRLKPAERTVLTQGSLLAALLAILPPLALADRALLIYAVANWCGVTLWQTLQPQVARTSRMAGLAHWGLAGGILLEVWLLATRNGMPAIQQIALAYALLAWSYLALAGPERAAWRYLGLAAILISLYLSLSEMALIFRLWEADRSAFLWMSVLLYNSAIFGLAYGWRFRQPGWFYPAGLLYGAAAVPILFLYLTNANAALMSLSLLPGGSLLMLLKVSPSPVRQRWLKSLAVAWLHLALLLLPVAALTLLLADATAILPASIGILGLGVACLVYGWLSGKERWHHLGIWIGIFAGGAVVRFFSQGTGRSAALGALLAILLITAERSLAYLARQPRWPLCQRCWKLYRRPLTLAGWLVAGGAALAALGRNLYWLGGGPTQLTWTIITLTCLAGLLLAAARAYPEPALTWPGTLALGISWTLLTYRLLPPDTPHFYAWFGPSWLLLALLLAPAAGSGALNEGSWRYPATLLAHLLAPAGVLVSLLTGAELGTWLGPSSPYTLASSLTLAQAALFYFHTYRRKPASTSGLIGLYLAAFLCEGWLFIAARTLWPGLSWVGEGLILLASTLPALRLARRLERGDLQAATVIYQLISLTGLLALPMLGGNRWLQGIALYYLAGLAVTATVWHRQPRWLYAASLATILAHGIMLDQLSWLTAEGVTWGQVSWATLLLLAGRFLRRHRLPHFDPPLLAVALALLGLSLVPALFATSPTHQLSMASIALLLTAIAYWQNGPLYLYGAVPIGFLAYMLGLEWVETGWRYLHLYALPAALLAWFAANWLDDHVGLALRQKMLPYQWYKPVNWWTATWERLLSWWSLPLYMLVTSILLLSSLLAPSRWHGLVPLALTALVWANLYQRTRWRIWLFAFVFWLQWLVFALVQLWLPGSSAAEQLLTTAPAAMLLLWVAARFGRREPWGTPGFWPSQALPLWAVLALDILILQAFGLDDSVPAASLTILNSLMLGIWAFVWQRPILTYGAVSLLALAMLELGGGRTACARPVTRRVGPASPWPGQPGSRLAPAPPARAVPARLAGPLGAGSQTYQLAGGRTGPTADIGYATCFLPGLASRWRYQPTLPYSEPGRRWAALAGDQLRLSACAAHLRCSPGHFGRLAAGGALVDSLAG